MFRSLCDAVSAFHFHDPPLAHRDIKVICWRVIRSTRRMRSANGPTPTPLCHHHHHHHHPSHSTYHKILLISPPPPSLSLSLSLPPSLPPPYLPCCFKLTERMVSYRNVLCFNTNKSCVDSEKTSVKVVFLSQL